MALIKNAKEMWDLCNKFVKEKTLCEKCTYSLTHKVMVRLKRMGFKDLRIWLEKHYKELFCEDCENKMGEMFKPFILKEVKSGRK